MSEIDKDDWGIAKVQLVETSKHKVKGLYPNPEPCKCAPQVTAKDIKDEIVNVLEEDNQSLALRILCIVAKQWHSESRLNTFKNEVIALCKTQL